MTRFFGFYRSRLLRVGFTFLFGLLSTGLFMLSPGSAIAPSPSTGETPLPLTAEELAYRQENPVLRVHSEEHWPPYNFMEAGKFKGLSNDYMRQLAQRAGFELEFVPDSWEKSVARLEQGDLDVISNMKKTPDREATFLFSDRPVFEVQDALLTRSNQPPLSLEDLEDKTLAVVRGYFHEELLRTHYPEIRLLLTTNTLDAIQAVEMGQADAAIETHTVFTHYIQRYFISGLISRPLLDDPIFTVAPQYLGIRRDRPVLKRILDKAMAALATERPQLIEDWTAALESLTFTLTEAEQQYLRQNPSLKLCADPDWYPLDAIQDGKHVGMSADFFELLRQKVLFSIDLVKTQNWGESLAAMESRRCDILALVTSGEETERDAYMRVTQPYLKIPLVLATQQKEAFIADISSLNESVSLGVVKDYLFRKILQQDYPQLRIVDVDSVADGLQRVERGEIFGFIDLLSTVTYAIQTDYPSLKVAGRFDNTWDLGVGVRNDAPELFSLFDKAIAAIDDATYQAFLSRWVSVSYTKTSNYQLIWQVLFATVGITLILLYRQHLLANHNRNLESIATTDSLTGCFNRLKVEVFLDAQIQSYEQTRQPFSIILCDIDHFKHINDRYGHLQGDQVLI
ncbi:MAG: transporter substrate-binding domain-containing diguanylate cyclase, partial [Prochlorothrix sp.]